MTAESIARALGGTKIGSRWMAKCPAHDDKNPSLSISQKDGTVLVHCFAGCDQEAVVGALKDRGIWEGKQASPDAEPQIKTEYTYTDEHGKMLYQVVRREPGAKGKDKDFLQRYPDGYNGWTWKKHERQVLYHLPEILESPIIFLVEGEKDCETLRAHGFVATTNAGGAEVKWLPSFTGALRGREVILIPDNDEPGRLRVLRIAKALLGHASRILILTLDPPAKDVTEWFEAGHSETELIALVDPEKVSN